MRSTNEILSPEEEIRDRVLSLSSIVEIRYTDEVKEKVYHYAEEHKKISATLLGRAHMYFPLIEKILKEKNLPEELKYLAVVESGLVPNDNSRVGAGGIWQFMKPTAEIVGLKISNTIDERRDPIKSTYAAAQYLQILFNMYNDWTLAIAAYNCGEGNINKAIKKSGGLTNFYEIKKYLPSETQEYLPKFIAIKYMMNYYGMHGIEPKEIDKELIFTATTIVNEKIDLKELAKEFGLDFEMVKLLNPSYIKNFIPKSEEEVNYLTLPEANLYAYLEKTNTYNDLYFVSSEAKHGDMVKPVFASNSENTPIMPVPKRDSEREVASLRTRQRNNKISINTQNQVRTYTVKLGRGQSLSDIAKENNVDLASLIEDNNYNELNMPKNGDLIKVRIN
jgi:hypothetical protein